MSRALALIFLIFSSVNPALADVFSFSYSGVDVFSSHPASGSGFFTAQFDSPGVYTITGISGSATFGSTLYPITGLQPPGVLGNTNLLFVPPSPGYFSLDGVVFTLANGATENLFSISNLPSSPPPGLSEGLVIGEFIPSPDEPGHYRLVDMIAFYQRGGIQVTDVTAPVPEPTTFVLIGTGLAGIYGAARRKRQGNCRF